MKRAFTLIELLVVIAVIAILVGLILPALAASRERARFLQCSVQMRPITEAMILYEGDNKTYPIHAVAPIWSNPVQMPFQDAVSNYLEFALPDRQVKASPWVCPSDVYIEQAAPAMWTLTGTSYTSFANFLHNFYWTNGENVAPRFKKIPMMKIYRFNDNRLSLLNEGRVFHNIKGNKTQNVGFPDGHVTAGIVRTNIPLPQ